MLRYFFLKAGRPKSFLLPIFAIVGLMALMGSSCDPRQKSSPSPDARAAVSEPFQAVTDIPIQPVVDAICQGDFEQARQILDQIQDDQRVKSLELLLDRYDEVQQHRDKKRQVAFQEQLDELGTIKETISAKSAPDVNDIDEAMVAIVRAHEYAMESQKEEVLSDPFVQTLMTQMKETAEEDEKAGKWLDAYAHCYYWLSILHEDDQAYKDKAEELTELSSIELAFKDSSCGETATERYEGIEAVMFLRAMQLLGSNYVKTIDYHEMTKEAIQRCRLIAQVLAQTQEDLAWSATDKQITEWNTGLETIWNPAAKSAESMDISDVASLLENVLVLNAITLKLPDTVVIAHFAEASFSALDPFTNLVWPWNVQDFEKSMTQQFFGIGVEISKTTGVLRIVSLLPDTPAYKSGLDADDEIIAVDGEPTEDMTIYCAVSKITGPKGTDVELTIRRPATGETKDVTITRGKIKVQPLRGWIRDADGEWNYLIDPDNRIGYVRLTAFTETSGPDLDEVLRKLEKEGLNGLVLDLRFNSGGYLQSAAEVVDLFIKEGVIVKSIPRQGPPTYEIAHRSGTHPEYPLVLLINGSSASASEIVAGALQDSHHMRATLVGQRSYGKGSVQVVTPFTGGGSQLKYTVAYYHLPSDQKVKNRYEQQELGSKDWGIAPDVEVEMLSNEMRDMIDIQRNNDVLARVDHEENGEAVKRHTPVETFKADPQLSVGLLVLKSKIVAAGKPITVDPVFVADTDISEHSVQE